MNEALLITPAFSTQYPAAYLLCERIGRHRFIFSVRGNMNGKRVLVFLMSDGTWQCRSCTTRGHYNHKPLAQEYAKDAGIIDNDLGDSGSFIPLVEELKDYSAVPGYVENPILYLPIPAPKWARLSKDIIPYPTSLPDTPPGHFPLDSTARCRCGCTFPENAQLEILLGKFTIFGLRRAYIGTIELAKCLECKHRRRFYGADLGFVGIFNWNNEYGFTHELLNQYTNVFTTVENPFSSFVSSTKRLYLSSDSPVAFCSTETFTRVWFAFTDIQELESGMSCLICGSYPDIVIADGVSIGYSAAKCVGGLQPPSLVTENSPVAPEVRLQVSKAAISSASLRK